MDGVLRQQGSRPWLALQPAHGRIQLGIPLQSFEELPGSLLVERLQSAAEKPAGAGCAQRVEDSVEPRVPPVPQDVLQIPDAEAALRPVGWIAEPAYHAIPHRYGHGRHQWYFQAQLQLDCRAQVRTKQVSRRSIFI